MHEARIVLLVIAPLDLATLGGGRVAGVAHVGRIALVAQQRPADLDAGSFERIVGAEEGQRMLDRHDRQVLTRHLGDQASPKAGTDDHMVGTDGAAGGHDALDPAVLDHQRLRRGVGEGLQLPSATPWSTSLPATVCERGMTSPASGSQRPPWISSSSISGNFSLISAGSISRARVPNALAEFALAPDLVHADIVADAGDLEAADPRVMPQLLVEIDRVERRPARQEVVAGRVAEVGGMRRRADVCRDARLVDADDLVPAANDQVMGDGRAHDATEPDDDDLRSFGKRRHVSLLLVLGQSVGLAAQRSRR